jgi:ABC-2 type transport system ATP-binding protein
MAEASRRIMIEAAGLSKFYGPFVAIKDVSFSIPEGQIVSFLGPNGAGKSTTMKILAGYLAASEGTARIAGCDMTTQRLEGARQLGYLPENGPLYNDMTPIELLRFFAEARELEPARMKSRIEAVVTQCSLEGVVEKPIGKLSRGYRQRVGLAQALLHDPAVLIMDEPAAGLDPRARVELRELLKVLAGQGKAILISSHILTELAEMCDQVGIIERGQLLAVGTVAEIQKQEMPHREVKVRVMGGASGLAVWLGQRNDVAQVKVEGESVRFSHAGQQDSEVTLLREMVLAEFAIAEFGSHSQSLEDVFMAVTRGAVQ